MPSSIRHSVHGAMIAALAMAGAAFSTGSIAMTLSISEDSIRSLANTPALVSLDGAVDDAARPSLFLELEFANDCYAAAGASVVLLDGPGQANAVVIVGQRTPDEGCPDIFQPFRASLRALLPPGLAGRLVTVVARPATEEVVRSVRLEARPNRVPDANIVLEIAASTAEIIPEANALTAEPVETGGYLLSGTLHLATNCGESDVRVQVFELPDIEGNPSSDAILVTAPQHCVASTADKRLEFSIRIETPQPLSGRRVVMLNAVPTQVLTLQP